MTLRWPYGTIRYYIVVSRSARFGTRSTYRVRMSVYFDQRAILLNFGCWWRPACLRSSSGIEASICRPIERVVGRGRVDERWFDTHLENTAQIDTGGRSTAFSSGQGMRRSCSKPAIGELFVFYSWSRKQRGGCPGNPNRYDAPHCPNRTQTSKRDH